jgi:hypothetical protein
MSFTVGSKLGSQITNAGMLSSSAHRLIIGGTGLCLRPTIDYYNGDVDKETRKYSAVKTAVKVAITVFNGVLTRVLAEKYGMMLVRKGIVKARHFSIDPQAFALGVATVVSFLATVATTFTLDIPLINYGLNFALSKIFPENLAKKEKQRMGQPE